MNLKIYVYELDWFYYNQEHIVKGDIVHKNGSQMLLFSINESLEILGRSEKLHCDGTLKLRHLFVIKH